MASSMRDVSKLGDDFGLDSPFAEALDAAEADEGLLMAETLGESPFADELESLSDIFAEDVEHPLRQRDDDGRANDGGRSGTGPGVTFPSGLVLRTASGATGDHEDHWDPHATGLPLLATDTSVQGEVVSPHFTVRELVSSGGVASPMARISPQLLRVLEDIRDKAGKPVRITSGYRSWKRNQAIYAARHQNPTLSRHCSGQAVDFKIAGMTGVELAKLAIDAAGTDLAIGLGPDFIHVDVRGKWTLWEYAKNAGGRAAVADVERHRASVLRSRAPLPVPLRRAPPAPDTTNRLVVEHHPMLHGHKGTSPDLVLRWANVRAPGAIDIVVHFHGYATQKADMRLPSDKEPASGLELGGRSRPTLGILPRGNFAGDQRGRNPRAYDFPALIGHGALDKLIDDALARLAVATGHDCRRGRLILTAHSGGGAALLKILAHNDPDEIHVFDGLYQSGAALVDWAKVRVARALATPAPLPPALRILYRPGTKKVPGTQPHSEAVARDLCPVLAAGGASVLTPFFRVDRTSVAHDDIPKEYGARLLTNAGDTLPRATTLPCPTASTANEEENSESLAWLDMEGRARDEDLAEGEAFEGEGEPLRDEALEVEHYDESYEDHEEEDLAGDLQGEDVRFGNRLQEGFEEGVEEGLEEVEETLEVDRGDYEQSEEDDTEDERFDTSDHADREAANSLTAVGESLDTLETYETEDPPSDKVDAFLESRKSLYKVTLVGTNIHITLPRAHAWTTRYTNRALTEGGVGAAFSQMYMGGTTAAKMAKAFEQVVGHGVKFTPAGKQAQGDQAVHMTIIYEGARERLASALNLTPKEVVDLWRARIGEAKMLQFAIGSAYKTFDKLVPYFSAKSMTSSRMSVELIRRLLEKHDQSMIEVAKHHPAAAPWRAAFKRNLALHWAERDPALSDFDPVPLSQWAKATFELAVATRDTLNAQIARQREEDRKHARNEHLRPHEIAVTDAAKYILDNFEPTHEERLHTTFWIIHGGQQLSNIKGEPIYLLRVADGRVIYQHLGNKKFYQQSLEGFGDEQLYGIYVEAGKKAQGAIALSQWVIGLAGAVFPPVRYGLIATDVLNAAFKLQGSRVELERSYESLKLAYANIDALLPGVLPRVWDAVLDKRNVVLFNPLKNPDAGAWLKAVIRLVMLRQARVVTGGYVSEAVTGFLNTAWAAIKKGLSALLEVVIHVVVLTPPVVGSTGISGQRALDLAKERLSKLGVADVAGIVLQLARLSKDDRDRVAREMQDLGANAKKLVDLIGNALAW